MLKKLFITSAIFILFTSFRPLENIIDGVPDDLNKHAIVFNKADYLRGVWFQWHQGYIEDYRGPIQGQWEKCLKELGNYPFKYYTIDARIVPKSYPYKAEELSKPEGSDTAKYVLEFIPEFPNGSFKTNILTIKNRITGQRYSLRRQKEVGSNLNTADVSFKEMKKLVKAVRKTYNII